MTTDQARAIAICAELATRLLSEYPEQDSGRKPWVSIDGQWVDLRELRAAPDHAKRLLADLGATPMEVT
ncbi:MAG TPA: hypothetical protein P5256_09640 [Beijerinckiaceae bacterium]|nr:hypothetical protein [Hyphomicrobiales bacterium]HRY03380.1 hypothetical protein [Beijerinckiaceae bacterium]